jgi:uncharacterized iron-regulated protein
MKKALRYVIVIIFFTSIAMKSDKPAYRFFNEKGKATSYEDVLKKAKEADIVFFGELHNSPICHWLEFELTKDLFAEKQNTLILGAEMFESDNQLIMNEYLSGKIRKRNFESEAKLWDNYKTDYKPLVEFAKDHNIPFIATNIPRRYASIVNKRGFEGLDSLDAAAKTFLPPLPITYDPELEGYKSMLEMMGENAHASPNLPKAQAIKDATMAHFILENFEEGSSFLHFNGTYHSNNYEGIVWYISQLRSDLNILTIASVEQESISELTEENKNLADFTLCIPESMSKSY